MIRMNSGQPRDTLCECEPVGLPLWRRYRRGGGRAGSIAGKQTHRAVPRAGTFAEHRAAGGRSGRLDALAPRLPRADPDHRWPRCRRAAGRSDGDRRPSAADAAKQKIIVLGLVSRRRRSGGLLVPTAQYFHEPEAVDRLVRVLMADAPTTIEKFRLLPTLGGVPQDEFDILRAPTERSIAARPAIQASWRW